MNEPSPAEKTGGSRGVILAAIALLLVLGLVVDARTVVGRATGGPEDTGCGGEPSLEEQPLAAATGDCSFSALASHPDNLQVLHEQVFEPLCVGCHSSSLASGGLDLSDPKRTRDLLVNVAAVNGVARENGWTLVRPGDPERSFLLRKVTSPGVGEGAAMPPGDHGLAEGYVDLLRAWIVAGAPAYQGSTPLHEPACDRLEPRADVQMAFAHPTSECRECHAQHVDEWSLSSHAYAAKDPVFHAMVRLGQAQSQGKVGQFCVQCHSPIGMALGETDVYFDEDRQIFQQHTETLSDVASTGVSCDVCHSVTTVLEPQNARMIMSPNGVRRATVEDPVENAAHGSAYSELHRSSLLCSSCHAVTTPKGALVEETFQEWQQSSSATGGTQCQGCHMEEYRGRAAPDAPERTLHRHYFAGVDVSLLPPEEFPGYEELRELASALLQSAATLSVATTEENQLLLVTTRNQAGHAFPSGATAERQLWIEVKVFNDDNELVFESGTLDEQGDLRDPFEDHNAQAGSDTQLRHFGQLLLADDQLRLSEEEAARAARRQWLTEQCEAIYRGELPEGVAVVTFPWQANWQCNYMLRPDEERTVAYRLPSLRAVPHRAEVKLQFRAFPPYFLRKLESSAALDSAVKERLPLVTVAEAILLLEPVAPEESPAVDIEAPEQ